MARIERYNRIDKPDVEDIVIGTDRDDDNQTKNFRLGDILGLAEGVDLNFIGLEDTPSTYENSAGKIPVVRFEEQGLIFKDPSEVFDVGALTFLELTDTPIDYAGQALKVLRVTNDEAGVEFYDLESVLSVLESSVNENSTDIDTIEVIISQIQNTLSNKIDDAPSDGKQYVRKDGGWVEIDPDSFVSIYNSDGNIDSDRTVGLNENNLTFSGNSNEEFAVSNLDGFLINNVVNVEINDANGVTINSNSSEIATEDSNSLKMGAISLLMNSNSTTSNEESFKVSFGVTSTTPDNKKGIEYNEDYPLNWDENTPDNLLTTKGYVDRTVSNTDSLTQSITGAFNIDWNEYSNWDLTLTGNTTISETNRPIASKEKTITIYVAGDFSLTLPTEWVVKNGGVYDGVNGSQIVVQSWNNGQYYTVIN